MSMTTSFDTSLNALSQVRDINDFIVRWSEIRDVTKPNFIAELGDEELQLLITYLRQVTDHCAFLEDQTPIPDKIHDDFMITSGTHGHI